MKHIMALLAALALAHPVVASESTSTPWTDEVSTRAKARARVHGGRLVREGVTVFTASAGTVDLGVELPGEVRPNADRIAHIAPRFPGIVQEVRVQQATAAARCRYRESEHLASTIRAAFDGTVIDKHIAPGEAIGHDDTAFIGRSLDGVGQHRRLPGGLAAGGGRVLRAHRRRAMATWRGWPPPFRPSWTRRRTAQARPFSPMPKALASTCHGDGGSRLRGDRGFAVPCRPSRDDRRSRRRRRPLVAAGDARPHGSHALEIRTGFRRRRIADDGSFLVKAELAGEAGTTTRSAACWIAFSVSRSNGAGS
jgi:hypothetical protein